MNILFLSLSKINDISDRGIYPDLVRMFVEEGHAVYFISPLERKYNKTTKLTIQGNLSLLRIRTLNIQKSNNIEKGLAYLMLEKQFVNGIKKFFPDVKFSLVLYSTPPITFSRVVEYVKKRDMAKSYLLLKDIFPQGAVDVGLIRKGSLIYNYFRRQEKKLYQLSDAIGCMSEANVKYIIKNNPEIDPSKVELNPNSIDPVIRSVSLEQKLYFRTQFNIPIDATIFIYGGNLGIAQGIGFLLDAMLALKDNPKVFFVIVGSGSEFEKINSLISHHKITNSLLFPEMPKDDYEDVLVCCDVGLIFLDRRFTIPNFPSRLLSYLESKIPVLAATDLVSDIGQVITENNMGYWVEHGDLEGFVEKVRILTGNKDENIRMGLNGYNYLMDHYTVVSSYGAIIQKFKFIDSPFIAPPLKSGEIVFINQSSGYLMIDIINAFKNTYNRRILITGFLNPRNQSLDPDVKVEKIIPYKRSSYFKRLFSWTMAFLEALYLIVIRHRKAHLFLVSNPPFAHFLPLLVPNSYTLFIYDVYPDALVENGIFKSDSWFVRFWERMNERVFARAGRVVTISNGMRSRLSKYIDYNKIEVIPVWTDNTYLKPIAKDENPFLENEGFRDKFIVMYSGNLGRTHNVEAIVDIAEKMKNHKQILFLIIGGGEKYKPIGDRIKKLKLSNILLLPWQPTESLPYSLSAADLAIVTIAKESSHLSLPSKVFSLLSVGAPILALASPESELAKIIATHKNGKSFEQDQLDEICDFILKLYADPQYLAELSANSLNASLAYGPENATKFVD